MKDIIISNPIEFEKKKQEFTTAGCSNFHVIADFDRTLTKAFVNGEEAHSSYAWVRKQKYLSPEYTKKTYELYDKYYPIERSLSISQEEKNAKMVEWWDKHLGLFVEYKLNKDIIKKIVGKNKIYLRDNGDKFMDLLSKNNIPLLIFSAGLGEIIKGFLELKNKLFKNIHIIANFLEFDGKGEVIGYKSKIIHTFNKNEYAIRNTPYYKEVEKRKNVLLLGDNLGDLGMSEGVKHNSIIKIGFLNEHEDKLLEKFKENYDVVILNDGSMDFVNELVSGIIQP